MRLQEAEDIGGAFDDALEKIRQALSTPRNEGRSSNRPISVCLARHTCLSSPAMEGYSGRARPVAAHLSMHATIRRKRAYRVPPIVDTCSDDRQFRAARA